jgi:hypothetical protein
MKLMAVCVAGLLISIGLCGIGSISRLIGASVLAGVGAIVFVISAFGMALSVLWFFVAMIVGAIRR